MSFNVTEQNSDWKNSWRMSLPMRAFAFTLFPAIYLLSWLLYLLSFFRGLAKDFGVSVKERSISLWEDVVSIHVELVDAFFLLTVKRDREMERIAKAQQEAHRRFMDTIPGRRKDQTEEKKTGA